MTEKISLKGFIIYTTLSLAALSIQLTSSVPGALAAGVDSNWGSYSPKEQNPDWDAAKSSIAEKDYAKAIPHLRKYITENPKKCERLQRYALCVPEHGEAQRVWCCK